MQQREQQQQQCQTCALHTKLQVPRNEVRKRRRKNVNVEIADVRRQDCSIALAMGVAQKQQQKQRLKKAMHTKLTPYTNCCIHLCAALNAFRHFYLSLLLFLLLLHLSVACVVCNSCGALWLCLAHANVFRQV